MDASSVDSELPPLSPLCRYRRRLQTSFCHVLSVLLHPSNCRNRIDRGAARWRKMSEKSAILSLFPLFSYTEDSKLFWRQTQFIPIFLFSKTLWDLGAFERKCSSSNISRKKNKKKQAFYREEKWLWKSSLPVGLGLVENKWRSHGP